MRETATEADVVLVAFLAGHGRRIAEEGVIWQPAGEWPVARFLCCAYACDALPPLDLVTSVRCIVRRAGTVLVLSRAPEDRDECHIVPGGRREPGKSIEQTLRRELLEETGWEIGAPRLLGLAVYRHQLPRPAGYPFPYPEFAQLVFAADAVAHRPEAMALDEIDGKAIFVPLERVWEMRVSVWQRAFLGLALETGAM